MEVAASPETSAAASVGLVPRLERNLRNSIHNCLRQLSVSSSTAALASPGLCPEKRWGHPTKPSPETHIIDANRCMNVHVMGANSPISSQMCCHLRLMCTYAWMHI